MTTKTECVTCQALDYMKRNPSIHLTAMAELMSDHRLVKHAPQISMFNDPLGGSLAIEHIPYKTAAELYPETIPKGADKYEAAKGLDEAMVKVERGIDPEFQRFARDRLVIVAKGQPLLTSDDIWGRMPETLDRDHYREPRHMSAILKWGVREHYISKNFKYVPSKSPNGNMGPHNQWRSLVFGGELNDGD